MLVVFLVYCMLYSIDGMILNCVSLYVHYFEVLVMLCPYKLDCIFILRVFLLSKERGRRDGGLKIGIKKWIQKKCSVRNTF